jgi:hypothetical protein
MRGIGRCPLRSSTEHCPRVLKGFCLHHDKRAVPFIHYWSSGRRVLREVCEQCLVMHPTHVPGGVIVGSTHSSF